MPTPKTSRRIEWIPPFFVFPAFPSVPPKIDLSLLIEGTEIVSACKYKIRDELDFSRG